MLRSCFCSAVEAGIFEIEPVDSMVMIGAPAGSDVVRVPDFGSRQRLFAHVDEYGREVGMDSRERGSGRGAFLGSLDVKIRDGGVFEDLGTHDQVVDLIRATLEVTHGRYARSGRFHSWYPLHALLGPDSHTGAEPAPDTGAVAGIDLAASTATDGCPSGSLPEARPDPPVQPTTCAPGCAWRRLSPTDPRTPAWAICANTSIRWAGAPSSC